MRIELLFKLNLNLSRIEVERTQTLDSCNPFGILFGNLRVPNKVRSFIWRACRDIYRRNLILCTGILFGGGRLWSFVLALCKSSRGLGCIGLSWCSKIKPYRVFVRYALVAKVFFSVGCKGYGPYCGVNLVSVDSSESNVFGGCSPICNKHSSVGVIIPRGVPVCKLHSYPTSE